MKKTKFEQANSLFEDLKKFMAKCYEENHREQILKAQEKMRKQGFVIGCAPIGYKHIVYNNGTKGFILDENAPHIKRLFELYAEGYNLEELRKFAEMVGLRNKNSRPLSKSAINRILNNPFYKGFVRYKDEIYKHNYKPLIDASLFNKCKEKKRKTKLGLN